MATKGSRLALTPTSSGASLGLSGRLTEKTAEEIQKSHDEELSAAHRITFSIDLAFAAKRLLGFLRTIDSMSCLHKGPAVIRAIRR